MLRSPASARTFATGVTAWLAAAVVGGVPSTVHAVVTGRDPLATVRAAGTVVPGQRDRPGIGTGIVAHLAVSAIWTAVILGAARRRHLGTAGGALAGAGIAFLDLEVIGRRYPAIRALPRIPQWLDHATFGAVVAYCADRAGARPRADAHSRW